PSPTPISLHDALPIFSVGTWQTPRMVSNEILSEARSTAQQERSVAAALADTNAQTTNDDNATSGPDATLAQPTGNLGVAGVQQRALPATAIDSAGSALQTRTLVITRTSE